MKKITNGDANAIMILAAEKMGLAPLLVDEARRQLAGGAIHPMTGAAMSKEGADVNNRIRHDPALIDKANNFVHEIVAEYGFDVSERIEMQCADENFVPRTFKRINPAESGDPDYVCEHCGWQQTSAAAGAAELCMNASWHSEEEYLRFAAIARSGGLTVPARPPLLANSSVSLLGS